jgi:hypothetical protein
LLLAAAGAQRQPQRKDEKSYTEREQNQRHGLPGLANIKASTIGCTRRRV